MTADIPSGLEPRDDLARTLKRTELRRAASTIPGREIVQIITGDDVTANCAVSSLAEMGLHGHSAGSKYIRLDVARRSVRTA